jgi:hypothetical protein
VNLDTIVLPVKADLPDQHAQQPVFFRPGNGGVGQKGKHRLLPIEWQAGCLRLRAFLRLQEDELAP